MITRRRFAFWIGLGIFGLANKLRVYGLDELAAAMMDAADGTAKGAAAIATPPVHWRAADNGVWRWFEQEKFIDGQWTLTGITTPIRLETGEAYDELTGYLDESVVPESVRRGGRTATVEGRDYDEHEPSAKRRSRHGRPPSKWLRSLHTEEIRIWLKTIEVPEAGVDGMTYWEHLTQHHSFDPVKIEGLTIDEQAKLHAAAHFGY